MWIPKAQILAMSLMLASVALSGCLNSDDIAEQTTEAILGCTYSTADNYNAEATEDDGSCTFSDDEGEPPAAFSTEGDVECDVFTTPTEDSDAVIGELNADGYIELLVEPGLLTLNINCLDVNGNDGIIVTTSMNNRSVANDPQYRETVNADDIEKGCWIWVIYDGWSYKEWHYPCPDSQAVATYDSGQTNEISASIPIIANAGHTNNVTIIYNWTSGENSGTGTITVVPANNVPVCDNRCISGWAGKVNQHKVNGTWLTDPDGVSGWHLSTEYATGYADRKLEYCQKWWPDTTSVQLRAFRETIPFYSAGNPEPPFPSTRDVYDCQVQEALDSDGDGLSDWDEMNIYGTNATNPDTDGDGVSDGDEINNGTDPLDPGCNATAASGGRSTSQQNQEPEPERCYRNSRERDGYSVIIEREHNGNKFIRTINQWNGVSWSHTSILTVQFTPMMPFLSWCPSHAPDFVGNYQNSHHTNHHQGWSPGTPSLAGQWPGPPGHDAITILATTSTAPGTTPENNHLWIWDWDEWEWDCSGPAGGAEKTGGTNYLTWYYLCPPHSGNMDDSATWAGEDGHFSIPPFNSTPDPPELLLVDTHTTDYYGENEHTWSYQYFDGVAPPGPSGWRWECTAGSIGEE